MLKYLGNTQFRCVTATFAHYPFGSVMSGRQFSAGGGYRYGFNGKEKDSDIAADNYDFGARIYDARIGRWMAVDPFAFKNPGINQYCFGLSSPLIFADGDGKVHISV